MTWVLILGLVLNAIALPVAARRAWFLFRLITSGQPAPDRVEKVTHRIGGAVRTQIVKVFGQKKLLQWTVPGAAHFFVFWAFVILATVYLEAYGALFSSGFSIPFVGDWWVLGFLQDFIAVMALLGIVTFAAIRLRQSPDRLGRRSRFSGSHLGPAWFTLLMIFNVVWTMFLFRGAASAAGNLPYRSGAFVSIGVGRLMEPLGEQTVRVLEGVGLLLHIGVMLGFLIFVLNSKHLHIFVAPLNVLFGRQPLALGAAKPLMSGGKPVSLEDVEDLDEDAKLGVGAIEDFSWKAMLDFATCTECGRCQSQCPAWNTEKPLSPKLLIMGLRDAAFAKAPYLLADDAKREQLVTADGSGEESGLGGSGAAHAGGSGAAHAGGSGAAHAGGKGHGSSSLQMELERPLVGDTGEDWFYMPENGSAVIDDDVLWSCVTCGACVQQCPVDIEHVDHILDMRRYQVLIESSFPSELNGLFKGLENKGNPWNMSPKARLDWAKDLPFEVKVVGEDVETLDEVDWLFWVGCAGAYEDRQKKTTRAVAELLDMAGVSFAVLGNGETCNGDPARRAGNEFVFQQLATQNAEVFKETRVKKVVATCAHCFNTLKNEYSQFGVELEVVHHTQLLNRLVREGRLTPVPANGAPTRTITYHDPCYLGRHNQVYEPPRELLDVLPGTQFREMERHAERSFCCGAGGARMWMEERIGERINLNRTTEAVGTGADQIAVGCPFCRVMLSDGLTALQSDGKAREEVEVLDVAQLLLASVRRDPGADTAPGGSAAEDTEYAATIAHDGTLDPEQAPDRRGEHPPQNAQDGEDDDAASLTEPVARTGDDGRKLWESEEEELTPEAREELKAELKSELRDELRAELLQQLRSDGATATGAEPAAATSDPEAAKAAKVTPPSEPVAKTSQDAQATDESPEPTPAQEPEPQATTQPEAGPGGKKSADDKPGAKKSGDDKPDDDGPMLIGSL